MRDQNGIIDLSVYRKQKEDEMIIFNAEEVANSIPGAILATNHEGKEMLIHVMNAFITREKVFLILQMAEVPEGEENRPFLMVASHKANKLQQDLRPVTDEEYLEYQAIVAELQAIETGATQEEPETNE